MKREPDAWGYNWATLSLGDINTETCPSRLGVGCKACSKKNAVEKIKGVKPDGLIPRSGEL
jgi:hypothetical protein